MKARVDQDACIGCAMCPDIAPEIFRMDDTGKAESFNDVDNKNKTEVQQAIDTCPVEAISWDE